MPSIGQCNNFRSRKYIYQTFVGRKMNNFNNAIIQWNNVRWIMARASEGIELKKARAEVAPEMSFGYFSFWDGQETILRSYEVAQCIGITQRIIPPDCPSESSLFSQVLELLDHQTFMRNKNAEVPSECRSCANYSGSSFLKCAINPTRTAEEDCSDFEEKALDERDDQYYAISGISEVIRGDWLLSCTPYIMSSPPTFVMYDDRTISSNAPSPETP
jgi:hypothetical protein